MSRHPFTQVDVFARSTDAPLTGNPVAVVHDAEGLDDATLQAFARWTNLSETTFLLPPTEAGADYRVRIFTPLRELPFAGHPTLGTAHAWLEAGGVAAHDDHVVQQCDLGLVEVRRDGDRLSFAAPGFLRRGPVEEADLGHVLGCLGVEHSSLLAAEWIDNGPGWLGLRLDSARTVLGLRPDFGRLRIDVGVIGEHSEEEREALGADQEVRAFCPGVATTEDPVTGSLNAGFAVWLSGAGLLPPAYVARQGTVLGAEGRVHLDTRDGVTWVGGVCASVTEGAVTL